MGEVEGEARVSRAARCHMCGGSARTQSEVRIGAKQQKLLIWADDLVWECYTS
jgi:hypothetical protein